MNSFCLETSIRLQRAAATLPNTVFSVHVRSPVQDDYGEDTSKLDHPCEAQEDFNNRRHWLVFETLSAAKLYVRQLDKRCKCTIDKSTTDTIEWLDLLVLNNVFSPYIAISLVKGKLVRVSRKWVK